LPISAEDLQARLLYRDALMLIVDKPAGIPVHRGPSGAPSLEDSFDALRFGLPQPPALAHRLDRDTSGCLVLGRHRKALAKLGRLFSEGRVKKTYWAIVEDGPAEDAGRIDAPLLKRNRPQGWKMIVDPAGQAAVTDWRVKGRAGKLTWLELYPQSGRTHQIRVHCASMGWPIVGDPQYGPASASPGTVLHLHARAVSVPLYPSRPPIDAAANPPKHMLVGLEACGFYF
jgi:tRNA pseudouridine32 synthase/23S rRNA pseudouridine746 synthase/23S rRNA pseudouridine1911/1915/1917 synthase